MKYLLILIIFTLGTIYIYLYFTIFMLVLQILMLSGVM